MTNSILIFLKFDIFDAIVFSACL